MQGPKEVPLQNALKYTGQLLAWELPKQFESNVSNLTKLFYKNEKKHLQIVQV